PLLAGEIARGVERGGGRDVRVRMLLEGDFSDRRLTLHQSGEHRLRIGPMRRDDAKAGHDDATRRGHASPACDTSFGAIAFSMLSTMSCTVAVLSAELS